MKSTDARQGLAAGAGAVTIALTAAAFWLSYEHLHDVAGANGLDGARAWAWPGTVDAFIVVGELLILRAALRSCADWFAYVLAAVGSLGSIALNVAGVGSHAEPLEYVVAAVPPTAALIAFAALMRQVHERLAGHAEVTTAPERDDHPAAPVPAPEVVTCTAPQVVIPDTVPELWKQPEWPVLEPSGVTSAVPAEAPREVVTEVVAYSPSELRRKAAALHRQVVTSGGRGVTVERLRGEFGLSRRDAAELRRLVVTPDGGDRS